MTKNILMVLMLSSAIMPIMRCMEDQKLQRALQESLQDEELLQKALAESLKDKESIHKELQESLDAELCAKLAKEWERQYYSPAVAVGNKELVIALNVDSDVIKNNILPDTKKQSVRSKMSTPSHLTVMWLKGLPSGYNLSVNNLQAQLKNTTDDFLLTYKAQTGKSFQVVVDKVEKGNGGIYLLPTENGNSTITQLILALKNEVEAWKAENPGVSVTYSPYFSKTYFLPHVTLLETAQANSIFSSALDKKNYGQKIEHIIHYNKPQGFGGIPIPVLSTSAWYQ